MQEERLSLYSMDSSLGFQLEPSSFSLLQQSSSSPLFNPFHVDHTIHFLHQSFSQDTPQYAPEEQQNQAGKKGLKHLAYILLQTLRKNEQYSHRKVAETIQQRLINSARGPIDEKNMKRRIYDALNVMISAGILEKELSIIRIRRIQTHQKNYSLVDKRRETQAQYDELKDRIEQKRMYLEEIKSKTAAVKRWMLRKAGVARTPPVLEFPLVFAVHDRNQSPDLRFDGDTLRVQSRDMVVLSETDMFELAEKIEEYYNDSETDYGSMN